MSREGRQQSYFWNWLPVDGTPAPYYDNVRVKVFPPPGPDLFAFEYDTTEQTNPLADLDAVHYWQDEAVRRLGRRMFFASDEARSGSVIT